MLKHSASALRAWRHAPWATFVNVLTLAVGLVSFVIAYGAAKFLSSADRQFANADDSRHQDARRRGKGASTECDRDTEWLAQDLKTDFPRCDRRTRDTTERTPPRTSQ